MRQTLLVLLCAGCWTAVRSSKVDAHLVLLGDSTIDNFAYVQSWEDTVGQQMKQHVSKVTDLSVECSRVEHVLPGQTPVSHFAEKRKTLGYPPYDDAVAQMPLKDRLQKYNPSHVLLSIIGNDVRALFDGRITEECFNKIFSNDSIANEVTYGELLRQIKASSPNVKLMVVMPYRKMDQADDPRNIPLAKQFLEIAKINQVPVIDLLRTFDPSTGGGYNTPHYYNTIEPNKNGAACLCKLAKRVIETHEWSGPSNVYFDPSPDSKCDNIIQELNNGQDHEINFTRRSISQDRRFSDVEVAGIVLGAVAVVVLVVTYVVYCALYKTTDEDADYV